MATRKCGNIYFRKKIMAVRKFTNIFVLLLILMVVGCMTWGPRRDHYRLLRRTHHRLLLGVIGYRREHGTYRQLSYAQALKKTGCQSVEATIRQRRLLFAGDMAWPDNPPGASRSG